MRVRCAHCNRDVDFEGSPPSACPACGSRLATAEATTLRISDATVLAPASRRAVGAPPETVAGYRILRLLGMGGMGQVFVAEAPSTGRQVALKLLSPEIASEPDAIERFRLEGRLAGMIDHPRCVFVYAADEDHGLPFIVMELMPGKSLQDLLSAGPLDPEDAVRKVLDVAEGLEEAHRLGVIHRDVKPSNCFLEPDGRVKVGDFGLSKWISADARLTQTGAFVGTPLYASPEQLKGQALDGRTDVYSVCATLYALLTGLAPFHGSNPVAMLARIVSETAPSVRTLRPGISAGLERVVMKGLERDRDARWRDMRELREALTPFVAGPPSGATLGLRVGAFLVDALLVSLLEAGLSLVMARLGTRGLAALSQAVAVNSLWIGYFALLEGRWGASAGKWLLRLRVRGAVGPDPPGVRRSLARVLALFAIVYLISEVVSASSKARGLPGPDWPLAAQVVGTLLLCVTMRKRNGYRGLHDLASGTRVVQHVRATRGAKRGAIAEAPSQPATRVEGLPERLGPYRVTGAYRWKEGSGVLLAEDPSLGRRVLIRVGHDGATSDEARRSLARTSRLRWLGAGAERGLAWEAFVAPAGRPITSAVEGEPWSWQETREVLEPLAKELAAATRDGTLPRALTPDQVWVESDGRIQIVDAPIAETGPPAEDADPSRRGLALAYGVALTALTGTPPAVDDPRLRRFASATRGEDGLRGGVCPRCLSAFRAKEGTDRACPGCGGKVTLAEKGLQAIEVTAAILAVVAGVLVASNLLGREAAKVVANVGVIALIGLVRAGWALRRRHRAERRPLLAAVPLYAARILERLPGGTEPYADPAGLSADLAGVRGRPARVTAWPRARQLAWAAGVVLMTMFTSTAIQLSYFVTWRVQDLRVEMARAEKSLDGLNSGAAARLIASAAEADSRRAAVQRLVGDPRARERVRALRDSLRGRLESMDRMWSLFTMEMGRGMKSEGSEAASREVNLNELSEVASEVEAPAVETGLGWLEAQGSVFRSLWLLALLWIALAMVSRGGLLLRSAEIAVVRRDGLVASPLRCAWRAAVAWIPLCAAVGTAGWLELTVPEMPWLAERVRFLGVTPGAVLFVLGALWLALALRSPERSPADALAGTRLVPR